ncbi:MAG: hypothetical protein STSR0008_08940 [Ignavibacterium sp.]
MSKKILNQDNSRKITCREVMDHICESLGEDFNSPKQAAIKKHFDECKFCQEYFKSIELTIEFYRNYNVNPSDECHKKLMNLLNLNDFI